MIPALAWVCRAAGAASVMLLLSSQAIADTVSPPISSSPLAGTLQMLFGLAIVLAAIAGTAWVLRRMAPGQVGSAGNLRVVAAVAVGPKERVVLVDVGETRLVLGVAGGQVNLLHEMPRPAYEEAQPGLPAMPPFMEKLKELMANRGAGK